MVHILLTWLSEIMLTEMIRLTGRSSLIRPEGTRSEAGRRVRGGPGPSLLPWHKVAQLTGRQRPGPESRISRFPPKWKLWLALQELGN